jgi:hypothetical protein
MKIEQKDQEDIANEFITTLAELEYRSVYYDGQVTMSSVLKAYTKKVMEIAYLNGFTEGYQIAKEIKT